MDAGRGADEEGDGNNEIDTANEIPAPPVGEGDMVTVHGFIGDSGRSYGPGTPFNFFDHDHDGDVDFHDLSDFLLCFGDDPPPECLVHDITGDGNIALDDFDAFVPQSGQFDCFTGPDGDAPANPECEGLQRTPPIPLKAVDIYKVTGLTK